MRYSPSGRVPSHHSTIPERWESGITCEGVGMGMGEWVRSGYEWGISEMWEG